MDHGNTCGIGLVDRRGMDHEKRQKQTQDSMEEEDDWTDADYRRACVIRAVDFRHFGACEIYEKHGYEAVDAVAKARCERLEAAKAKARLEAAKPIARNDCEQEAEAAEDALLL
ncbi:hypothetical protein Tco_1460221 [Tanacetum coccineum]